MHDRLLALLKLPPFANDEDARVAGILNIILCVLLGASLLGAPLGLVFGFYTTAVTVSGIIGVILFALWLTRRGYVNAAGFFLLLVLLGTMTFLAYIGNGIHDHAMLVFPLIIIIASLILQQRSFVLVTLLCIVATVVLFWAELNHRVVNPFEEDVSPFDFVIITFILVITAVFTRLAANNLTNSLADAREKGRALAASIQELERSNRELQQFAYVSSHDLQEPLRKIQTFSDRFQHRYADVLDERGLDYLQRMQDAAARMQTLIQDLLAFSRVNTQVHLSMRVDLNNVLEKVLADLETHIEKTQAQVDLQKLPVIEGDPTQMRQLFQNLISNALKFHRPDVPPIVRIWSEQAGDDREEQVFCQISVQDNGIGFEEKYSERIFGVFQRLHGRDNYNGTGVGLAICRRIVERHDGRITAHSVPGQGSTFIVKLPIKQPEDKQ